MNLTNLADGTYNVTMMTLITNREDQQWQPTQVNYGYSNSFELIKAAPATVLTTPLPASILSTSCHLNMTCISAAL